MGDEPKKKDYQNRLNDNAKLVAILHDLDEKKGIEIIHDYIFRTNAYLAAENKSDVVHDLSKKHGIEPKMIVQMIMAYRILTSDVNFEFGELVEGKQLSSVN